MDDTRIFIKTAVLDSRSFQQYMSSSRSKRRGTLVTGHPTELKTRWNTGHYCIPKTHTDRYLQFESHHPTHIKRGVVRSLFNRAQAVTLNEENVQEAEHLEEVLQENGYPIPFYPEIPGETTTTRWRGAVPQSHRGDPVCSGGE